MFGMVLLWVFIFVFIYYFNKEDKEEQKDFIPSKKRDKKRVLLEKIYDKDFSKEDRRKIYEKYRYQCFKCGSKKNLTIDHHMPLTLGYGLSEENAVLLCKKCNSQKSNKLPLEFYTKKQLENLQQKYGVKTDYTLKRIKKKELESNLSRLKNILHGKDYIAFDYLGKKIHGIAMGLFEEREKAYNKRVDIYLKVLEGKDINLYLLRNIKELYIHNKDKGSE